MNLRELLYFQKSDRKILFFLLLIGVAAILLFFGIGKFGQNSDEVVGDSLSIPHLYAGKWEREPKKSLEPLAKMPEGELFYFDPNTVDSAAMARLGLSSQIIRNIYKYRAAGGIFQHTSDFAQLYGLTVGQYRRLEPYIRISDDFLPASEVYERVERREPRDTSKYVVKVRPGVKVPINASDTTAFKTVPGIGSYFAYRIVSYREKLGGYTNTSQLLEIEDFPESALDYFVLDEVPLRKINLNKLTVSKLKLHPYIDFFQARAIYDFCRLKHPLTSIKDLKLLKEFSPSDIERLAPYVEF